MIMKFDAKMRGMRIMDRVTDSLETLAEEFMERPFTLMLLKAYVKYPMYTDTKLALTCMKENEKEVQSIPLKQIEVDYDYFTKLSSETREAYRKITL